MKYPTAAVSDVSGGSFASKWIVEPVFVEYEALTAEPSAATPEPEGAQLG